MGLLTARRVPHITRQLDGSEVRWPIQNQPEGLYFVNLIVYPADIPCFFGRVADDGSLLASRVLPLSVAQNSRGIPQASNLTGGPIGSTTLGFQGEYPCTHWAPCADIRTSSPK